VDLLGGNLARGIGDRFHARHRLDVDVGERRRVVGGAQAVGGVAGDDAAVADQRDVLAQLFGLLEVVRGEGIVVPSECRRRM
jgi:hypothetical protein